MAITIVRDHLPDGDELQIDIMVEIEGQLTDISGFSLRSGNQLILSSGQISGLHLIRDVTANGGEHIFRFDNPRDSRRKTVHLLLTYHQVAPGAKAPR